MSDVTVVRASSPDCMIVCRSDGKVMMGPHAQGVEGLLWQTGAAAALQKVSESSRAECCRRFGIAPDISPGEFADRFSEIHLAALRMSSKHATLAALLPAPLQRLIPSLGEGKVRQDLDLANAQFVLQLVQGRVTQSAAVSSDPMPVGTIARMSDGILTRFAVVETPMGDPIWISIARSGIVIKRSGTGFFGQSIYKGGPLESAQMTQRLYDTFGGVQLPCVVKDPVLRVWIQTAICMRDAAQLLQVLR